MPDGLLFCCCGGSPVFEGQWDTLEFILDEDAPAGESVVRALLNISDFSSIPARTGPTYDPNDPRYHYNTPWNGVDRRFYNSIGVETLRMTLPPGWVGYPVEGTYYAAQPFGPGYPVAPPYGATNFFKDANPNASLVDYLKFFFQQYFHVWQLSYVSSEHFLVGPNIEQRFRGRRSRVKVNQPVGGWVGKLTIVETPGDSPPNTSSWSFANVALVERFNLAADQWKEAPIPAANDTLHTAYFVMFYETPEQWSARVGVAVAGL